ncbi:unnamed protein product [Durusdinium trenchii]|uniref:SF-assemblin n=1 Tax=Durusdinium trenchii TaxID=1381693 RepID=A0ABP0Q3T3_9DINO
MCTKKLFNVQILPSPLFLAGQDRLEFVFMKKLDRLDHSVAAISQRMSVVERDFALTREKHMQDMLRRNQHLAQDAEKFMSALRSERADRQHRADGFARQLSDYEAKTRTLISSQMQMREQQYQSLREQLDEVKRKSDTGDDELQRDLEEKVADIKAMLAVEQKARTQADDDIMQALKHYTTCIQEALRTINQN